MSVVTYFIDIKMMDPSTLLQQEMHESLMRQEERGREYSVTELSNKLKGLVENQFEFVKVKGEVSGYIKARSGHVYFSLKDSSNTLSIVCWKYIADNMSIKIEDGMEVVCSGKISTYGPRSSYNMVVSSIEVSGEGRLLAMLEERKKRLAAQGYFDRDKKKEIPVMPQVIGVITSTSGAVIQDILNRIKDRFPSHVVIWDVAVQGQATSTDVVKAIEGFNSLSSDDPQKPDLVIVARGGGSIEDLWPFNDESIVHAVYQSELPIISAVGHETDVTLIDYAADLRAATPTAAAEKATSVTREALLVHCGDLFTRMSGYMKSMTEKYDFDILYADKSLIHYKQRLDGYCDEVYGRITRAMMQLIRECELSLKSFASLLDGLSFDSILRRGFAIMLNEKGEVVSSISQVSKGEKMKVTLSDGEVQVVVK